MAEPVVRTIMHSPLTSDPRFQLVFESDNMPSIADGWEALSGNDAEAYMLGISTDADHQGTVETDNRFKYFFANSGDESEADPVL